MLSVTLLTLRWHYLSVTLLAFRVHQFSVTLLTLVTFLVRFDSANLNLRLKLLVDGKVFGKCSINLACLSLNKS